MRTVAALIFLGSSLTLSSLACSPTANEPSPAPPGTPLTSTVKLGFDDVVTSPWAAIMPPGYGGLLWENFFVADSRYPAIVNTGYRSGTVSVPNAAYNGSMEPATIRSSSGIDIVQAHFTSAYAQTNEPYQMQIQAYRGATLVYTRLVSMVTTGPTIANLNLLNVDRIVFTSLVNPADQRRSQFVMDDLVISRH